MQHLIPTITITPSANITTNKQTNQKAGAFAAVTVDFLVYPFDTIKTRVQSPNYEKLYKDPRTGAIRRNVLFRGLYQGVWSVVLSTIPSCTPPLFSGPAYVFIYFVTNNPI